MTAIDPAVYHKLYGEKHPRAIYYEKDFLDYVIMLALSAAVLALTYGLVSPMSVAGYVLCAVALGMFVKRHGVELKMPLILRRPQDLVYMFVYKLQNVRIIWILGVALLVGQNVLIAMTPTWPHHVELMHKIAIVLFYAHIIGLTLFRTVILADHLRKKELIREILSQTPWRRVVNEKTNVTLEIFHAYFTGVLTHIILIAPWYLVIKYSKFSLVFLPAMAILNAILQLRWIKTHHNSWFYRDHWLGHNSELEFVFLHGTHHDAIPSALIGVAGNGFLEGFVRHTLGTPAPLHTPLIAFLVYSYEVKNDIELHQYIPGVFPRLSKRFMKVTQHSTHHYGRLEPYGLGVKLDLPGVDEDFKAKFSKFPEEITNSIKLDEELTGFEWDNPTYRLTQALYEKYQN